MFPQYDLDYSGLQPQFLFTDSSTISYVMNNQKLKSIQYIWHFFLPLKYDLFRVWREKKNHRIFLENIDYWTVHSRFLDWYCCKLFAIHNGVNRFGVFKHLEVLYGVWPKHVGFVLGSSKDIKETRSNRLKIWDSFFLQYH